MNWFDALPEEVRTELAPRLLTRRHRRGEAIVDQGDPSTNVYLLDAGHVAVRVLTPYGEVLTTTVLGPGASFGEVAHLSAEETRSASVVALDDVRIRLVPGRVFEEVRTRFPEVTTAVAVALAARLRDLSDRFAELASDSVPRRCGRRIVELAEVFAEQGARSATIPLTQDDLAGIVGTTRPTMNQALGQLVQEGLIAVRRGAIEVPDRRRLRDFVR